MHYLARHGETGVAKAAILCAVPPLMVKTAANPNGLPKKVFDDFQVRSRPIVRNSIAMWRPVPSMATTGRARRPRRPCVIQNWWRQGMMGGAKAHYDGIVAFSQTDFTEDLKKITVPVLVMHSEDDQIVPYVAAGPLSAKLAQEWDAEDLQGLSARHADHGSGHDQRRPAGVYQGMSGAHLGMKVILFGATGMVGQGVLRECLLDAGVERVLAVGRSSTGQQNAKLRELLHNDFMDFSAIESELSWI